MADEGRWVAPEAQGDEERGLELRLRPARLSEFIGQARVRETLGIAVQAATARGEPLDHVLLSGPPGLGKTTLAHILAAEMGAPIQVTSGPALEHPGDMAAILTALPPGGVLFVDEIHRLHPEIVERLYAAMEDFAIDLVLGKGPGAKTLRLTLPRFTLIGATTRIGALSGPMRDRFGIVERLEYYTQAELQSIAERAATVLGVTLTHDGAEAIARRGRGTARVANRLLRRLRDFAEVRGSGAVDADVCERGCALLDVDELGLDRLDRRVLRVMAEHHGGGPVGLGTLAAACSEEQETIEDTVEPYLMQVGLLQRTPRGRMLTALAYRHLGLPVPAGIRPAHAEPAERGRTASGTASVPLF